MVMMNVLVPLALLSALAGPASAAVIGYSETVPLSDFGATSVSCTTGGIPVGDINCDASRTPGSLFFLTPFDLNLGTLTSATLSYSVRLDGTFITRTPVVFGTGEFRTDARIDRGGSTVQSATTGDVRYTSSTFQNEGAIGQRRDGWSLDIEGSVALDTTRVTYDPLAGESDLLSYLLIGLYVRLEAGIVSGPSCAFGNDICGATNRILTLKSLRDLGPVAGEFDDALFTVTYTYDEPPVTPPSVVPLPAAPTGLLTALACLVALRRRRH
jgi:hypothetical protein